MQLAKYRSASGARYALTPLRSAANLPIALGPWVFRSIIGINATDGERIGASSLDILAAVELDGFFMWPGAKPSF